MNAIATIIGWFVIWAFVALAVAVPLGKFIGRKREYTLELAPDEDLPPRPPFGGYTDPGAVHDRPSRYVPPQLRQFSGGDLEDPTPHEPAP